MNQKKGVIRLSPAYDLLNATIANPKDDEGLAQTLNGKKRKSIDKTFISLQRVSVSALLL